MVFQLATAFVTWMQTETLSEEKASSLESEVCYHIAANQIDWSFCCSAIDLFCLLQDSLKTRDESVWWVKIIPRSAVSDSVHPKPRVSLVGKRQLFSLFHSGSRLPPKTMGADSLAYLADTLNLLTGLARGGRRGLSLSREVNLWPFQFRPSLQSPVHPGGHTSRHKGAICFSFPAR